MLDLLSDIMNAFGAAIIVPIIIYIIALIMKVKPKRAFQAGLNAGIGLTGFGMIIGAYTPVVTPVINRMGVCTIFCVSSLLQIISHSIIKMDHKPIHGNSPIFNWHCPFLDLLLNAKTPNEAYQLISSRVID